MTIAVETTRDWNGLTIPTAGTYELDPAHKRVGFIARHMMVSKVRGEFADVTATITIDEDPMKSSVIAVMRADSITTGSADRDAHLRADDFLAVEKYPTLTFRSTGVAHVSDNEFLLDGELTVKDAARPVQLRVEFEGAQRNPWGKEVIGFAATTEIDREDFGLTWNMALETGGVMVGRKVKIEIEGEAVRQA